MQKGKKTLQKLTLLWLQPRWELLRSTHRNCHADKRCIFLADEWQRNVSLQITKKCWTATNLCWKKWHRPQQYPPHQKKKPSPPGRGFRGWDFHLFFFRNYHMIYGKKGVTIVAHTPQKTMAEELQKCLLQKIQLRVILTMPRVPKIIEILGQ